MLSHLRESPPKHRCWRLEPSEHYGTGGGYYGGRRVEYAYDNLYRLTQEAITDSVAGNRTATYTYDPVGNRLTRNDTVDGSTTYVYDANDRLLTETRAGQLTTYTYDGNGNTLSRFRSTTDQVTYTWNDDNRLIRAEVTTDAGTRQSDYLYNYRGIRVASTVDGQETRYLIDDNRPYAQVLEEYDPNGTVQASYVYGHQLISQERAGVQSFHLVDGLGSVRVLTDASGNVTDTASYDAFGTKLATSGSTDNAYGFAGEQFDQELGQYYLRDRYYDTKTGRFSRKDSFEGYLHDPMSRHGYVYGHGNPVNFTDPSGFTTLMELKVAEKIGFEINATAQVASLAKTATQANLAIRIYEAAGVSIAATTAIGLAGTLAPIIGSTNAGRQRASKGNTCDLRDLPLSELHYTMLNLDVFFRIETSKRGWDHTQTEAMLNLARMAGIRPGALLALKDVAESSCVNLRVRFSNEEAPRLRNLGHSPKPYFIKVKTVKPVDAILKPSLGGKEGLTAYFDPDKKFADDPRLGVKTRYERRKEEVRRYKGELEGYQAQGIIGLGADGLIYDKRLVVDGRPNLGYGRAFTGDIDLFDFTDPRTGNLLHEGDPRFEHTMKLLQGIQDVADNEHPPLRNWVPTSPESVDDKQGLLNSHQYNFNKGHGELLQFNASGAVFSGRPLVFDSIFPTSFSPSEYPSDFPLLEDKINNPDRYR